jgi:hypothetical protein
MENQIIEFKGIQLPTPIIGGHRVVPIKTICELIDVNIKSQIDWIKTHPVFSKLGGLHPLTGADGKTYEMYSLPMIDAYSWLSSISLKNRKEGSEEKQYAFMAWFRDQMVQQYQVVELIEQSLESERELIRLNEQELLEIKDIESDLKRRKEVIKSRQKRVDAIRHNRVTGQIEMELLESPE